MNNIYVYGDSIMKATLPDENMKYRFHIDEYMTEFNRLPVSIVNRAKFGAYADKGLSILEKDIARGIECDIALVEFGGNDCNFDWAAIAAEPESIHNPKTILQNFLAIMTNMITKLRNCGITPVMMTLPPIDAEKYFECITRDGKSKENILRWLGDVNVIYNYQEMYSNAIAELAEKLNVFCIDMRNFLLGHKELALVSADGIHPSAVGYDLIFGKLFEVLKNYIY